MNTIPRENPRRTIVRTTAFLLSVCFIFAASRSDADNLFWRGRALVNSNWDNTTVTNWYDANKSALTNFTAGAIVTFDDTGTNNPVIVTNAVEPGSVTVSANTVNYVLAGIGSITNLSNPVAGTNLVSLTKNNNATLTIQTTNSYTGVTTLNGGIVSVGQLANGGIACAIGAAGNGSTNLIFNGGELLYNGPSVTINRGATLNANGGTLAVTTAGVGLTNSGVIAGIGGLTVSSNGIVALSGANTYSGGTMINNGTTLVLTGGTPGSGNVTNNGTLAFNGISAIINNDISGTGILTNLPGATTVLGGTNTFTGNFVDVGYTTGNPTRGILVITNSSHALDGTSQVMLEGGNAATLALYAPAGTGQSLSIPAGVTLTMVTGGGTSDRAALTANGNPCTWNGPINLAGDGSANEVITLNANSSLLTINGNITAPLANNYAGQFSFSGTAGDSGIFNGQLSLNTNASLLATGSTTWRINSTGNIVGGVWAFSATIQLGVNNALPSNVPLAIGQASNTGKFDLAGYNQQIEGLTNAATTGAAIITNSTPVYSTLTYSNTGSKYLISSTSGLGANGIPSQFFTNYSGVIAGKLNLTVAGGILSLQGVNTYSGVTTVSNGTILALTGNGSIAKSASIIIGPSATFSEASSVGVNTSPIALGAAQTLMGAGATGTLAGNIYMQSGSSLVLNYNGSTPTLVITNGTFTCTNSGVVTVNVPNSLQVGSSYSYLLVSNGVNGTVAGNVPISVVVNGLSDVAGTLAINAAGLVLTVTNYTPKDLEWRGTVSTNWDTATTNWFDTDVAALDYTNFATLDNVTFDDNVMVSNNLVNLTSALQPGMVTVLANNTNYTFNGVGGIVGGGGLTMSGNSTLTILTTNSYTGVTALNSGIVSVNNLAIGGAASAIGGAGSASANIVFNGGQLQYTGPSVTIDRGATLGANGGSVAVTTAGSVLTTSGTIAGNNGGGLTVPADSGIFALAGINSYNGPTIVSNGGTLELAGGTYGSGNVTNNGTLLFSGANTVVNNISGSGIITNAPGGTLTLSGTNTDTGNIYSGVTQVSAITTTTSALIINNSAALAANTTVSIGGGNSSSLQVGAGVSTPTNVTLVGYTGNANTNRFTLSFLGSGGSWNGPVIVNGDGAAVEANGNGGDFFQISAPGGAIGTINGNITAPTNGPQNFNGQIDIRGVNSHGVVNGSIRFGGGASMGPNDGAVWTLNSPSNTWGQSGVGNGQFTLGVNNALPATVALEGGGSSTVGILDLAGYNQQVAGLTNEATGTGAMIITNSSAVYATFTYSNPADFYQAIGFTNYLGVDYATTWFAGTYTNYSGVFAGNITLDVAAGILNLQGVDTYTGATIINTNAELILSSSASIGNSTNIIIGTNAILAPSGQSLNSSQTLTGAGGTGTIAGNLTLGVGSSLVFNNYNPNVPTLTVSNSTLTFLGGNTATVNVSGSPTLAQASYLLISTTAGGLISGTPPTSVTVNGLANAPGTYGAYLSIQGGQLYLVISQSPVILNQYPVTYTNLFKLYKGANPTFSIATVSGAPPFTYQWYTNGVQDNAATGSSLQLTNVQSSFANDYCVVSNAYNPPATSFVWSASVIADPTNLTGALAMYPSNVLSLNPIAYWRLNEADDGLSDGNPGALTHDYAGGNDALYTNVNLGESGYNPHRDPSDTSTLFGIYSGSNSYAGQIGENIDFGTPSGSNAEFSVETWVALNQNSGGGIIAKGWGQGGEEFSLDSAAGNDAFRFFVRSAAGTPYLASSTIVPQLNSNSGNPQNNIWYHLVGVCDEANSNVLLYVNGVLAASNSIPALSGIVNDSSVNMTIGARSSNQTNGIANPPNLTLQTVGTINDVAVFNYALSPGQIAAEYQAAQPFAPIFTSQLPVTYTNLFTLFAAANPAFSLNVSGTTPLSYQWFTNGILDAAATSSNLALANVQIGFITNYCIVTNVGGSATSTVWAAAVIADPTAPYPTAVLANNPVCYWRMNEPDDGSGGADGEDGLICHDYLGGNDGIYTNVYLGYPGYSSSDPTITSVLFGFQGSFIDNYAGPIEGVDFAAPAGTTTNFTIEAWEEGYASEQKSDSAIVSKGVYNLNDAFALDYDATANHNLRFYVRAANGTVYSCTSSNAADNNWHHLAGVCDETDGALKFYIDGTLVSSTNIPATAGLYEANYPMSIGAAQNASETAQYTLQYAGYVNDVAAYNYALSAGQVANQYDASGNGVIAPYFAPAPPTNASANANSTLTIPVTAIGTPPISFVWTNLTTGAEIASGATNTSAALNATLNYANVPANWNGDQLQVTVSNASGTTNAFVTLAISNINTSPTNIVASVTNNLLYLSWPTDHIGWQLQAQTNSVSVGISNNWVNVNGSTGTNQVAMPINPANGTVFYRLIYP
jgi:autotransporter-associated beta strand protein